MLKKLLIGIMLGLSLLFASCYPELSVQQYDKLKQDLVALDVRRAELELEIESLNAEIAALEAEHKADNADTRAYLNFLDKMISTQSSARILTGQFDVESLVNSKETLVTMAKEFGASEIGYYVGLMNSENESETVSAYYKTVEYCIKEIKKNLQ